MISTHVSLQCWIGTVVTGKVVGPKFTIVCHSHFQTGITIGVRILWVVERALGDGEAIGAVKRIDEVLGRAVTALTAGITHGEVVRLESVGRSRATSEKDFLEALWIGDVADVPKRIERNSQSLAASLGIEDELAVCLSSSTPKSSLFGLALTLGKEWRSLIEGCLCLECLDGKLAGTTSLWLIEGHIANVGVIGNNLVLDVVALRNDELEDLISRGARQSGLLLSRHVVCLEGDATILTDKGVIEVSACPTCLILIVVVEEHLLLIVLVEGELLELEIGPVVEHLVAVGDAFVGRRPDGLVRIGGAPVAIVEVLDGVAIVAIDRLVGSRSKHSSGVVAPIGIDIVVNLGHEAADIGE